MQGNNSDRTGAAVRKLRLARGWTLGELAERSGIPLSTLSRVEIGQNALNYDKLVRLCRALEVDLQGLVAREAEAAPAASGRRSVVLAGTGAPVRIAANTGLRAAADLLSKTFSPVVVHITATSLEAHGPLAVRMGEAYVLVLAGAVEFHSHLYAPLRLGTGDAVYFDASSGYALIAEQEPARALLVVTGDGAF